jgi:hypothetical protein
LRNSTQNLLSALPSPDDEDGLSQWRRQRLSRPYYDYEGNEQSTRWSEQRLEDQARGILEQVKEGWNRSIENGLRKMWSTDWNKVREEVEEGAKVSFDKLKKSVGDQ